MRLPKVLPSCQTVMNEAAHITTGQQPSFAFFGRFPSHEVGTALLSVDGTDDGVAETPCRLREVVQGRCHPQPEKPKGGLKQVGPYWNHMARHVPEIQCQVGWSISGDRSVAGRWCLCPGKLIQWPDSIGPLKRSTCTIVKESGFWAPKKCFSRKERRNRTPSSTEQTTSSPLYRGVLSVEVSK